MLPSGLKQVCHAEKFSVRWKRAIGNHVFCALRAFLKLEEGRSRGLISSWYEFKRHLIDRAVGRVIQQMAGQHYNALQNSYRSLR